MDDQRGPQQDLATRLLYAPLGLTTMRIFLWLLSVVAALALLSLLVLRPSLVSTSDSSVPSQSTPQKGANVESREGVMCVPLSSPLM